MLTLNIHILTVDVDPYLYVIVYTYLYVIIHPYLYARTDRTRSAGRCLISGFIPKGLDFQRAIRYFRDPWSRYGFEHTSYNPPRRRPEICFEFAECMTTCFP